MRLNRLEPACIRALMRKISGEDWLRYQVANYSGVTASQYELNSIIPYEGIEAARKWVSDNVVGLPPGGKHVTVARFADSGKALAEWLYDTGTDPDWCNLTNQDVSLLQPSSVMLLSGFEVFRHSNSPEGFLEYIKLVRKSRNPVLLKAESDPPDHFTTNILDIGLTWEKPPA